MPFLLLLFILLSGDTWGQPQKQYSFVHYSKNTGLATNDVHAVVQDRKGFIWLGTAYGLLRFDGIRYLTFKQEHGNRNSIPENSIQQLIIDHKNRLWLLFSGGRVGIFNTTDFHFSEYTLPNTDANFATWDNKKLIAAQDGRIFYLLCNLDIFELDEDQKKFKAAASTFQIVKGWNICDLVEDVSTKKYWLSGNFGIAVYNPQTNKLSYRGHNVEQEPLIDLWGNLRKTSHFFIDSKHRLWLNSWPSNSRERYVYAYDLKKNVPVLQAYHNWPDVKIYHEPLGFFEQRKGMVWIKGKNIFACYKEDANRFEAVNNEFISKQSIVNDQVTDLTEDREGNMWVATRNNGLYRFNPAEQSFTNIRSRHSLMSKDDDEEVSSFIQTSKKTILTGEGKGLHEYDSNLNSIPLQAASLKKVSDVWDLSLSNDARMIWIGAQRMIFAYDQLSHTTNSYDPFGTGNQTISQVQEDNQGNLWIGTLSKGVYWWPRQYKEKGQVNRIAGFELIPTAGPLKEYSAITDILCDKQGYVWIATFGNGVYVADPGKGKLIFHYTTKGSSGQRLLHDNAFALLQYDDSTIIILAGGLNFFNKKNNTISLVTPPDALSVELTAIEKDLNGNLWISSATNGIGKYNMNTNSFMLFDRGNGINNDNFQINSSLALPDGRLLFGSSNQFVCVNPASKQLPATPPDVTITDFKVMNKSLPLDSIDHLKQLELSADENYLNIEFTALNYGNSYAVEQKLEGLDENWNITTGGQAVFSYLPPGTYRLLLRSKDASGATGRPTRITIRIRPHFWRTWWFNTLVLSLAGAIIYAIHKQRVNRLLEIEKVRTRVARDLHDDIGSSLSTINILSKVATAKLKTDQDISKEYIQKITESSGRIMDSMGDIIWTINPVNDTMGKILVRIKEFVADTLEPKEINFNILVAEDVKQLKLDMESRRDFFLIFKEAINNIAKYADARNVLIEIGKENASFRINITDDGKGFDVSEIKPRKKGGHGLQNMKARARQLKGDLCITSTPGKGTSIQLTMPIG